MAAAARRRVWMASSVPGRRELAAMSRRLIPSSCLPPGTRVVGGGGRHGTQARAAGLSGRLDAAPMGGVVGGGSIPLVVGNRGRAAAALTATTHVFLAANSSCKRPRITGKFYHGRPLSPSRAQRTPAFLLLALALLPLLVLCAPKCPGPAPPSSLCSSHPLLGALKLLCPPSRAHSNKYWNDRED